MMADEPVVLTVDAEDAEELLAALAGSPLLVTPQVFVSAESLTDSVWVVAVFPETAGPLATIPLLMLFCETGAPHVPAAVKQAVDQFNSNLPSSWMRVRHDAELATASPEQLDGLAQKHVAEIIAAPRRRTKPLSDEELQELRDLDA